MTVSEDCRIIFEEKKKEEYPVTMEEIFKTMQDLIAEQFAIDADEISMESSFAVSYTHLTLPTKLEV